MMDEILQKLLESELLSEESKAEIKAKFEAFITEAKEAAKADAEAEVRAQLTEEFIKARDELVTTVDNKVDTIIAEELEELRGDIEAFRDLEVEHAEKLAEEKDRLAVQLGEEIDQLVDKIDAFLEVRLTEEFAELKEDIEVVKKDTFGRRIFEAFSQEFAKSHLAPADSLESKVAELQDQLDDAKKLVNEMETEKRKLDRSRKLDELLGPLQGSKKEHMRILLSNIPTEKLQETFNRFIGRVLKEDVEAVTPAPTLTEEKKDEPVVPAKVVTGNEEVETTKTESDSLSRLKRLAGI
jgi:hypothetical protein